MIVVMASLVPESVLNVKHLWGMTAQPLLYISIAAVVLTVMFRTLYWRFIDITTGSADAGSATGLSQFGAGRLFEAPRTGSNYPMKERAFRLAHRYAHLLCRLVLIVGFFALLVFLTAALTLDGTVAAWFAILAITTGTADILMERWLSLAEVKHTVTLYFGSRKV